MLLNSIPINTLLFVLFPLFITLHFVLLFLITILMFVLLVILYSISLAPSFYSLLTCACASFPMAKLLLGPAIPPTIGTTPLIGRPQAFQIPAPTLLLLATPLLLSPVAFVKIPPFTTSQFGPMPQFTSTISMFLLPITSV